MSEILVSVYITNYNYGTYLKQAIDSVLNQTIQDFELIIIDDGSTDESRNIIESYRNHPQIKIVFQNNKGLNASNNVALNLAQGKYLIRLDADDIFEPAALGVMSSILEGEQELGLVFPDYYYIDQYGNRIGSHRRHLFDDEVTLYDQPAHGACTMVRRKFLIDLDGYDESFNCQDGYELWVKFISFHKVSNVNRPLFSYRQHDFSLSTNQTNLLQTRKLIKSKFVNKYLKPINTLIIIPVREKSIAGISWPSFNYNGKSILEHKVNMVLQSNSVKKVVITTDNEKLFTSYTDMFKSNNQVDVVSRSREFASLKTSINKTIKLIVDLQEDKFDAVGLVSLEYPLIDVSVVNEAIDTLNIFKSDSVITVIAGQGPYYRHTGQTLKAILDQDKYTVLEREYLFSGSGGVAISNFDNFSNNEVLISNRVAHVLLDHKHSFGVFSDFDFELFKKYISNES